MVASPYGARNRRKPGAVIRQWEAQDDPGKTPGNDLLDVDQLSVDTPSGESAAGVAPAAARRTVREPLGSHGSHHLVVHGVTSRQ
jgi:hypothetical protein